MLQIASTAKLQTPQYLVELQAWMQASSWRKLLYADCMEPSKPEREINMFHAIISADYDSYIQNKPSSSAILAHLSHSLKPNGSSSSHCNPVDLAWSNFFIYWLCPACWK